MNNEIKRRLPLQCPACDAPLKVGRMFCGQCDTEVCGTFELPVLAKLTRILQWTETQQITMSSKSDKEQQFVIDFIKSSGSLKDMAKNMGVSYPTVRNILDDLIDKLNKIE